MSFRLVLKSVTLNDLEWRNGPYYSPAAERHLGLAGAHFLSQ